MMRLYILVEGQTEEKFVKDLLVPHLRGRSDMIVTPIIVTTRQEINGKKRRGGGRWKHWLKDLLRLSGHDQSGDIRFTTLFDLYGLPDDFPGLEQHKGDRDTKRRAQALEQAMKDVVDDWRLIPYLQRHEFEALVLASLDSLHDLLDPIDRAAVDTLRAAVLRAGGPEDVNDGEDTAPSKRLEREIASYEKTTHGPLAVEAAGLSVIRERCPDFSAWLGKLEALAAEGSVSAS